MLTEYLYLNLFRLNANNANWKLRSMKDKRTGKDIFYEQ